MLICVFKVSTIDESVGRIVKTLKENGLYENTLIGDHCHLDQRIEENIFEEKSFWQCSHRTMVLDTDRPTCR